MHSSSTRVQEHIGDPISAEPVLPREKLEEVSKIFRLIFATTMS